MVAIMTRVSIIEFQDSHALQLLKTLGDTERCSTFTNSTRQTTQKQTLQKSIWTKLCLNKNVTVVSTQQFLSLIFKYIPENPGVS